MKQQKRYEDALRGELIARGVYQVRNEEIIRCAARCQKFIDMMEDELAHTSLMISTLKYGGSISELKQHPHVESIRKYNHTLAYCLVRLGLANNLETEEEKQQTQLDRFMIEIENGELKNEN